MFTFSDWSLKTLKVGVNEETLPQKYFELMLLTMLYGCVNGKEAKHFCFRDTNSASSRYLAWVPKQGSIRETFKVRASQVIPRLPSQHMLKTQNLCLGSKNAFEIFQKHFLHPGRIFASTTMFPFLRRP